MASDHATHAAAVAAGYTSTATDRGANVNPRWQVVLEKRLTGAGSSGVVFRAIGEGASQAAAESQALASLNAQRAHRYGRGATNNVSSRVGAAAPGRRPEGRAARRRNTTDEGHVSSVGYPR